MSNQCEFIVFPIRDADGELLPQRTCGKKATWVFSFKYPTHSGNTLICDEHYKKLMLDPDHDRRMSGNTVLQPWSKL